MADRGIIFSAPMVRALMAGAKTQTRRFLKPQPHQEGRFWRWHGGGWGDGSPTLVPGHSMYRHTPARPGDRLWVKEACAILAEPHADLPGNVAFRADLEAPIRWRSPIHMPRWASRLTLTVTDVRVQRLQEISDEDALAEGVGPRCQPDPSRPDLIWVGSPLVCKAPNLAYRDLWNGIHGPSAWDANPWVVAITFTVERRNIDAAEAETERAA